MKSIYLILNQSQWSSIVLLRPEECKHNISPLQSSLSAKYGDVIVHSESGVIESMVYLMRCTQMVSDDSFFTIWAAVLSASCVSHVNPRVLRPSAGGRDRYVYHDYASGRYFGAFNASAIGQVPSPVDYVTFRIQF
jgi:hypothetical protein